MGPSLTPLQAFRREGSEQPWQALELGWKTMEKTAEKLQGADKEMQPLWGRTRWRISFVCQDFFSPPFSICLPYETSEGVIPELHSSSPHSDMEIAIRLPHAP